MMWSRFFSCISIIVLRLRFTIRNLRQSTDWYLNISPPMMTFTLHLQTLKKTTNENSRYAKWIRSAQATSMPNIKHEPVEHAWHFSYIQWFASFSIWFFFLSIRRCSCTNHSECEINWKLVKFKVAERRWLRWEDARSSVDERRPMELIK